MADIFGSYIDALRHARAKKAKEQDTAVLYEKEAREREASDVARRKQDMDIMARTGGAIRSGADLDLALRSIPMRSEQEILSRPAPTTGPARPMATEEEQLAPMRYAEGLERLAKPSFDFETQALPGDLGTLVLPKTYTGMPRVVQPKAGGAGGGASIRPPAGYRFLPNGDLEVIPGGPEAQKREQAAVKIEERLSTQRAGIQNTQSIVEDAASKVDALTAGPLGQALSNVGGTRAANLESEIKTIQANLGFDRLAQMRAESPTGGALGNVSNLELDLLTSAVTNLSQKQSPDSLRKNVERVRAHLGNWIRLQEQYAQERKAALKKGTKEERLKPQGAGSLLTEEQKARLRERLKGLSSK